MSKRPGKTATSRLFTVVGVILACFLEVGIWRAEISLLHKNKSLFYKDKIVLPAPLVEPESLMIPSPSPPAPPEDNNALLAHAVEAQDEASAKTLLEQGADPNKVTSDEQISLLAVTARNGNLKIAKLLLQYGADVNPKDSEPPLVEAARNGNLEIAKLLLRHGADVNPNKGAESPLAWASYSYPNALPMMRLLIRAGADVNARFDRHTTVMSIARFHSGDEAVALLKRAGAYQ